MNAVAYMAYEHFENFKRPHEMSLADYINEFERLNKKIIQFDEILPTGVFSYEAFRQCKYII